MFHLLYVQQLIPLLWELDSGQLYTTEIQLLLFKPDKGRGSEKTDPMTPTIHPECVRKKNIPDKQKL